MSTSEWIYTKSTGRASAAELARYTASVNDLLGTDPTADWLIDGRPAWGGYCGDSTQVWWIDPSVAVPTDNVELEIGVIELEILAGLEELSGGGEGLLLDVGRARQLAYGLLAAAAAAENEVLREGESPWGA